MGATKLNGSVDRLAIALREVFSEAVEGAIDPLRTDIAKIRSDMAGMEGRLNDQIDTTNKNMQAQFSEQEKKLGELVSSAKS